MRILLIAPSTPRMRSVRKALCEAAYAVDVESNVDAGARTACLNEYDLVVVDGTPEDGVRACAAIRGYGRTMHLMMLSDDAECESKVRLLEQGADDYLSAPFALSEFVARVHAVCRRPHTYALPVLSSGDLILCTTSGIVRHKEKIIDLTRKEFMLLEYLMRHPGTIVTRAMILEHVWDMSVDAFTNTIETHIVALRKKLSKAGCRPTTITTVSGRGYAMMG